MSECSGRKYVLLSRHTIALVLDKVEEDCFDGPAAFRDFVSQNSTCYWNACLVRSVAGLEYRGALVPSTLLVSGSNFSLEVVRSAWARRVLRPPNGYIITKLGDLGGVDMQLVLQTQFAPLSEALCKVISELNRDRFPATPDSVLARLEESFPLMQVPQRDVLHRALGSLIRERSIYHTGNGYFIVSPDTYRQLTSSPVCERQMLLTNEEAIVRLHGQMDLTQVPSSPDFQQSHSSKDSLHRRINLNGLHKSEKQSVLGKLLKRMQFLSTKHVVFSAQFPPTSWLESDKVTCHSVATQTIHKAKSKIPWEENIDRVNTNASSRRHILDRIDIMDRKKNLTRMSHPRQANYMKRCHRWSSSLKVQKPLSKSDSEDKTNTNKTALTKKLKATRKPASEESEFSMNRPLNNKITAQEKSSQPVSCYSDHKELKDGKNISMPHVSLCNLVPCTDVFQKSKVNDRNSLSPSKETKNVSMPCADLLEEKGGNNQNASLPSKEFKNICSKALTKLDNVAVESLKEKRATHENGFNSVEEKVSPASKSTLADSSSSIEKSDTKTETVVFPTLKMAKICPQEIIIDNSVSVEVGKATTAVVTEETTVTKEKGNSKVVTVTSIMTSLSNERTKDEQGFSESDDASSNEKVNDLDTKTGKNEPIIDYSTSCNIITDR